MTAKFRQIIEQLKALVRFKADKPMTDDDFIVNIETIDLLINVHDDLGPDRKGIRRRMSSLYPEFSRRICGKKNIQLALPLIKALNDLIYGREDDRGPERWQNTMTELKKRSGTSTQLMLEYLRSQVISEFAKQDRLRTQRKLR